MSTLTSQYSATNMTMPQQENRGQNPSYPLGEERGRREKRENTIAKHNTATRHITKISVERADQRRGWRDVRCRTNIPEERPETPAESMGLKWKLSTSKILQDC